MNAERRELIAEAVRHLHRANELAPQTPRYAALLGRALLLEGRAAEALPHLEAGFAEEQPPVYAWLIAVAHHLRGDYEKSRQWSSVALEESPRYPRALALRADCCERLGDADEALADWRCASDLEPDKDVYRLRTSALLARRAWSTTDDQIRRDCLEEARRRLLDGLPKAHEPRWRYLVGCVLLELGEPRRALVHLDRTDAPNRAELAFRKGVCNLMLGHKSDGVPQLEVAANDEATCESAADILERSRSGRPPVPGVERLPEPVLDAGPELDVAGLLWADDSAADRDSDPSLGVRDFIADGSSDSDRALTPVATDPESRDDVPATFDTEKARELLATGRERNGEKRHRLAGATLCRAFDVLDRPGPAPAAVPPLRRDILAALLTAAEDPEIVLPLARRTESVLDETVRLDAALVRAIVDRASRHADQDDDALWRLYVAFLDTEVPCPAELRGRIVTLLSERLSIRLDSDRHEAEPLVPLLERLHRARPKLAFPRLYLGRWACLQERYADARDLLAGIGGRLAERPKVLNLRGRCAELLALESEAEQLFARSLDVRDDQADIHFRVGRLVLHRALDLPVRLVLAASAPDEERAETISEVQALF